MGPFLRRPTPAEAGQDPVAAEAASVGDEEEMPLAKRAVVALVQRRTVAASVHLQLLLARCGG